MVKKIVAALILAVLCGCAAKMTPEGSRIREIFEANVYWARENCEFLQVIDVSEAIDRLGAVNQVRNKTAELGGTHFLRVEQSSGGEGGQTLLQAEAYRCPLREPDRPAGRLARFISKPSVSLSVVDRRPKAHP